MGKLGFVECEELFFIGYYTAKTVLGILYELIKLTILF